MSGKVALIVVFNHRYDKNIEVLEKIYKGRFSNIYHLVPFYTGNKKNVIPVYENSFYFQGYFAQGCKYFLDEEYEHYLFVADDLLLNPNINEHNYKEVFRLSQEDSFIPEIFNLHHFYNNHTLHFNVYRSFFRKKEKLFWWRIKDMIKYNHVNEGLETKDEMPSYEEAQQILQKHGYHVKPLTFRDVYGFFPSTLFGKENQKQVARIIYRMLGYRKNYPLAYPLVASYSDIIIVSKKAIKNFCHYCGVFAANNLFVECAAPTALLLAAESVVTEKEINKRGEIWWLYTEKEIEQYDSEMQKFEYKIHQLLQDFPKDKLYMHPVKLSKWK